MYNSACLGRRK